LEAKNFWTRALVIMVNLAVVGIIFVNTSRTALIYVALVVSIYIIRFHRFRLYAFTASLLLVPVIFARYRGDILNLYDLAVYRFTVVSAVDESYNQRSGLIWAGVNAVRESWGFGVGIGGFEEYINDNYPYLIPNPHNILLEIAINFGLLALVLVGVVISLLLLAGLRRKDLPIGLRMALVLGSISVPIVGAVPSQAFGYVYWWVWLATMIAIANIPRHNHSMSLTPALHRQPA
jgi:O-antigen ligase